MIDIFVIQVEEMWNEMQYLNHKKDYESLGNLAHKAKSSVAIMGMNNLSEILKKLEISCRNHTDIEIYQDIINNFKAVCLMAIEELQNYKLNH